MYTILVLGRHYNELYRVKTILENEFEDYVIHLARNILQVYNKVQITIPDLILLDTGRTTDFALEILNSLKENENLAEIPVIGISRPDQLEVLYDAGVTDYVKKPLDKTELKVRVKSTLAMFKLLQGVIKQSEELEKQSLELELQKQALEQEKLKSDNLLLNILPLEIAEQLKNKGTVQAKHYRMVSVLFADFKGFTRISEKLSSEEVVAELTTCFEKFDEIVEAHFVEKIKTIGDAYMCAGGLPIRNKSNPIDVTLAALQMQHFMATFNRDKRRAAMPTWELRIGIHTGEVVAGVIGKKKFAYDIWGDTVNTASRMESSGSIHKVNISESTYNYVKKFFECTFRGKIKAKNKGEISMYFVEGLKPEYAADESRVCPNQKFKEALSYY